MSLLHPEKELARKERLGLKNASLIFFRYLSQKSKKFSRLTSHLNELMDKDKNVLDDELKQK